ncbi:MAG TPA: response regulator [Cyclobacteriaceae bacterium]|nr:response regulator [Cyclobacteriaceae bacterium]
MQLTKILLVDDREDNLMSIEAILGQDGYEFFRAYSGTEALKILLAETDFALILMDVKMPVLNGFETATMIYDRQRLKGIPIIFITANNYGDDNVYKGYEAGGIDYILKPINPQILRAKVSVFVNLYRAKTLLQEQERKLKAINETLNTEIRDRKASEEKVRYMNFQLIEKIDQLERANVNLKRLQLIASNEITAPLEEISRSIEKLTKKYKGLPEDSECLKTIEGAISQIQAALHDIPELAGARVL